jgi:hypothetical protein
MRSMADSGMALQLAAPVLAEALRTPSISTMFWLLFAPRMNTDALVPGPPLRATSMPRWRCSSSVMEPTPERAISSAVMTVVSLITSRASCGVRPAVTMTVSALGATMAAVAAVWANTAGAVKEDASANASEMDTARGLRAACGATGEVMIDLVIGATGQRPRRPDGTEAHRCGALPPVWPVSGLAGIAVRTFPCDCTVVLRTAATLASSWNSCAAACLPLRGQHTLALLESAVFPV